MPRSTQKCQQHCKRENDDDEDANRHLRAAGKLHAHAICLLPPPQNANTVRASRVCILYHVWWAACMYIYGYIPKATRYLHVHVKHVHWLLSARDSGAVWRSALPLVCHSHTQTSRTSHTQHTCHTWTNIIIFAFTPKYMWLLNIHPLFFTYLSFLHGVPSMLCHMIYHSTQAHTTYIHT